MGRWLRIRNIAIGILRRSAPARYKLDRSGFSTVAVSVSTVATGPKIFVSHQARNNAGAFGG